MVIPLIKNSTSMLDVGTGGGEFLSKLQPLSEMIYATKGYLPNVPKARKRLEPLGVEIFKSGKAIFFLSVILGLI
jgi:hypothetical protein